MKQQIEHEIMLAWMEPQSLRVIAMVCDASNLRERGTEFVRVLEEVPEEPDSNRIAKSRWLRQKVGRHEEQAMIVNLLWWV